LQRRRNGGRQINEGSFAVQRCLLAYVSKSAVRSVWTRHGSATVGGRNRFGREREEPCACRVRVLGKARCTVLCIPRSRCRARRCKPCGDESQFGRGGQRA